MYAYRSHFDISLVWFDIILLPEEGRGGRAGR